MLKRLHNHNGLLYLAYLNDQGQRLAADFDRPDAFQCKPGEILWLHMCAITPATREFLENDTELDEIIVRNLLAEETRPRSLVRKDGILVILRAMNLKEDADPEDMISLRIWMDDRHIITTRLRDTKSIEDMQHYIETDDPPCSVGRFLTMFTDRVYGRMEPFMEDQDDGAARLEELLARQDLAAIDDEASTIRLQNAVYRRYIVPQKQLLEDLLASEVDWIEEEDREQLVESLDRVTRYIETLNDVRDRLAIINDETARQHDASLNSTTYIFTAAATIFLPLSFLTGLLGVNVAGIPGIEYQPSFWIVLILCIALAGTLVYYFRRKGWF